METPGSAVFLIDQWGLAGGRKRRWTAATGEVQRISGRSGLSIWAVERGGWVRRGAERKGGDGWVRDAGIEVERRKRGLLDSCRCDAMRYTV